MTEVRYAGFWIRVVAEIGDSIVLWIVSSALALMLLGAGFWASAMLGLPSGSSSGIGTYFQVVSFLLYGLLSYPYYVWGQYRYGATLTKRALGISVVNARDLRRMSLGQAHLRAFGYVLSSLTLGIGYLMVAFHPRKQALHDLLAETFTIVGRPQ